VSLGEIERATKYLNKSVELNANTMAYEFLGTIQLKQHRYHRAARYFDAALSVPGHGATHEFNRAKILRLASEAYAGAGNKLRQLQYARSALEAWRRFDDRLPDSARSEMFVERGKLLWGLGEREIALRAFDAAIDIGSDDANAHAAVIAFLVVRDQYDRALDAYHRALGSREIGSYFKVYMSLWVLAEAAHLGRPADSLATEFLRSRKGPLWYDQLARFATHRLSGDALARAANTRARRAEMLYYRAVLGKLPENERDQLLREVIATNAIMFFEYDMAQALLSHKKATPAPPAK
jgi:tetratricopeptide (TPR) repeat protein